jgi:hypothetical protein
VVGLRHRLLILVKSSAGQCFDAPAVYARNKKDAAATPRAGGARMAITGGFYRFYWCRVRELNSRPTVYKTEGKRKVLQVKAGVSDFFGTGLALGAG